MKLELSLRLPKNLASVPGWVLAVHGLTPAAWRLLVALWAHVRKGEDDAQGELPVVYPGPARRGALADDQSADGRNQRRWLRELEEAGLVRLLTIQEQRARQLAGLVVTRDCRVLLTPSEIGDDSVAPEVEGSSTTEGDRPKRGQRGPAQGSGHQGPAVGDRSSASGHQRPRDGHARPPDGHERPPDRSSASGHRRPVTSVRQNGHQCPPDRSSVSAPIEQTIEQTREHEEEDEQADNLVVLPAPRSERVEVEASVTEVLRGVDVVGSEPGPTFISPIVERLLAGDCDLRDVERVAREFKRRRDAGDNAQGQLRALFFEGSWARTRREYLGHGGTRTRAHASRRGGRRSPRTSDMWDEFERGGER